MTSSLRGWFTHRSVMRDGTVILLWAISMGMLLAHDLFEGVFPSPLDFGIFFGFGLAVGAIIGEFQRTIFGCLLAFGAGVLLVFVLGSVPALNGTVPPPGDQAIYTIWLVIIFKAIFPLPFTISLVGSLIGVGLGETYLD